MTVYQHLPLECYENQSIPIFVDFLEKNSFNLY